MERTISAMVGKGSVNHNSRKFKAQNVDGERTDRNIDYCNEPIKQVYHRLFDAALERYNAKQTRADRKIADYYEKIRSGKQEKPFHELILQIGDKDNMSATGEYADLARDILDEYYQDFQARNPNLYVFSAHLHMDEATPHLHIDFVPYTTGSKRGLDTRVSLKRALAEQGFRGGTRQETEWNQWVQAEKEQLASVMERYGVEWEHRDTHEKHLSVLDYEKKMRDQEVKALESEARYMEKRIASYKQAELSIDQMKEKLAEPEYTLPDPSPLMTAKAYRSRHVEPVIEKLKQMILNMLSRFYQLMDDFMRVNKRNGELYRINERLGEQNRRLGDENRALQSKLRDYHFLQNSLGREKIETLLRQAQAQAQEQSPFSRGRDYFGDRE